ncbi:MAG: DNA repair protein RecN [Alphaproteobacteria bacterium]
MLAGLSIHDVVILDRLDLSFQGGLSVLTGETGAGKSILLDALGLALGERSDAGLIAKDAGRAVVSAVFEPPDSHPVRALLAEQGFEIDGPLVLRRVLNRDGRTRAFINDQPASVGLLRRVGEALVEVQGQFEQRGLLNPASHCGILDAFGGLAELAGATRRGHAAWREAEAALEEARAAMARAAEDEDYLRHALGELETLDPRPGEEDELDARRATLMNREKLTAALESARGEVAGRFNVEDALRKAQAHLERASGADAEIFAPVTAALERASVESAEAVRALRSAGIAIDGDAGSPEDVEERLFALRELARKHRVKVDELPEIQAKISRQLDNLDNRTNEVGRLSEARDQTRAGYLRAGEALSQSRIEAALKLDRAVALELPPLKLERATFATRIERLEESKWDAGGLDRVAFEVATNPGAALGPLGKIASGGELARFMLALKVVLAQANPIPTLIFDEVDTGIGGATAAAVGERLDRLARTTQVLVVTHSPQVAARGAHHWRVVKDVRGDAAVTRVDALADGARVEEIARMLSGHETTDEARSAAGRLIAGEA